MATDVRQFVHGQHETQSPRREVEAGYDPKVIQQRMGHDNIETTLKFYAQPTKDRLQAAADVATVYLRQG